MTSSSMPVPANGDVYGVVVADDDRSIRAFLAALIAEEPTLKLLGEAADAEEAIRLTLSEKADAVVLDWWMPEGGGPRAAREISERSPSTGIVAFTAFNGAAPSGEMLAAGAKIYLVKSERSNDEILEAIRRAASNGR
jgi:DNA-binding NarL/FixJ family response regulator